MNVRNPDPGNEGTEQSERSEAEQHDYQGPFSVVGIGYVREMDDDLDDDCSQFAGSSGNAVARATVPVDLGISIEGQEKLKAKA